MYKFQTCANPWIWQQISVFEKASKLQTHAEAMPEPQPTPAAERPHNPTHMREAHALRALSTRVSEDAHAACPSRRQPLSNSLRQLTSDTPCAQARERQETMNSNDEKDHKDENRTSQPPLRGRYQPIRRALVRKVSAIMHLLNTESTRRLTNTD